MRLRHFTAVLAVYFLAACAGLPGQVSTNVSDFDGRTEVTMSPGHVRTPGAIVQLINLGARWTSEDPDNVYLIAVTPERIVSIPARGGLQFSVHGDVTALDSPYLFTETEADLIQSHIYTESSRTFVAPLSFVESLPEGAKVRLLIGQDEYYEGVLSSGPMTAYDGLRSFLARVRSIHPAG